MVCSEIMLDLTLSVIHFKALSMADNWNDYQEEAATFFRGLGLEAETNVTLDGVRTSHNIDVVVRSHYVGFNLLWLVECKYWRAKVSKLHVLALRQIVIDLGADRGILLSETGFQGGAVEASDLTNVTVTSLAEFQVKASTQITSMRFCELHDRIDACRSRYWAISKSERIAYCIRPEVGFSGYCGITVIEVCTELTLKAFRGVYPIKLDSLMASAGCIDLPSQFNSPEEVLAVVGSAVSALEAKLSRYENHQADVP